MTLRDTELIGNKLVKHGFYRYKTDHQSYRGHVFDGFVTIHFKMKGTVWSALITHEIDVHTTLDFRGHEAVFTPEWLVEEHKKLQAMFKFIRG